MSTVIGGGGFLDPVIAWGPATPGDTLIYNAEGQWVPSAGGGGVTPETVFEALLPLGKVSADLTDWWSGYPGIYDPDKSAPNDDTTVFALKFTETIAELGLGSNPAETSGFYVKWDADAGAEVSVYPAHAQASGNFIFFQAKDDKIQFGIGAADGQTADVFEVGDPSDPLFAIGPAGEVTMSALPTSDPVAAGRLWNSTGTLKVSAG